MSNPYGETNPDEQRPQPRYGAYSQSSEGSGETPDEQPPTYGSAPHGGQHNPYGQPSWGQPDGGGDPGQQSGQPSPYGEPSHPGQPNPSGQPGYPGQQSAAAPAGWQQSGQPPPGPYPGPPVVQKPKRPTTMIVSMVLMLVAAATSLAWGIYVVMSIQAQDFAEMLPPGVYDDMVRQLEQDPQLQQDLEGVEPEQVLEMTFQGFAMLGLLWALVLVALYVTLAFVGIMTGNVGRVLATIWLAGSLFFLLFSHDDTSLLLIGLTVLISLGALVLLWLPPSNTFVQQRRAFKDARRRAPYAGPPSGPPPGYSGPAPGNDGGQQGYGTGQPPTAQPGPGPGGQNPYGGGHNPYGN